MADFAARRRTESQGSCRAHDSLAGDSASSRIDPHRRTFLYLYWWLRSLVFPADHTATIHWMERWAHRLDRIDSICCRFRGIAASRLELRSFSLTAVAFC